MTDYGSWSHQGYLRYIFPLIESLENQDPRGELRSLQTYYCRPNESGDGVRLYPSMLTLLAWRALNPTEEVTQDLCKLATAVELYHNFTLTHDDILDSHDIRRNRPTIVKTHGKSRSMLVGNMMISDAMNLLASLPNPGPLLSCFAQSLALLNIGQNLDEHDTWLNIPQKKGWDHWWHTSRLKLEVGVFAAKSAAIFAGRTDLVPYWETLEESISLVSQIINDTGDVFGFTGFYTTVGSDRKEEEETAIKSTYPILWLMKEKGLSDIPRGNLKNILLESKYIDHARDTIETLRCKALNQIDLMQLPDSAYRNIWIDYLNGPKLASHHFETKDS